MLSIRNLTKSYRTKAGRNYVFKDISVDFPDNVNIGILGPNGAGKSTFLRILGGIDHPDSGTITCQKSMSWPLGLRGGFVGNLTGRKNCHIVCSLYGIKGDIIKDKLEYIKELSGIGNYFEEPVKYYSSGMSSRIGFALSMAFDFEILLIDEITSVGDRNFRDIAKRALEEKRDRSNVIMVSHSMATIRDFCNVGVLIKDGKMEIYDDLDEAVRAYLPDEKKRTAQEDTGTLKVDTSQFKAEENEQEANLRKQISGMFVSLEQAFEEGEQPRDAGQFYHLMGICYARMGDFARSYQYHQLAISEVSDKPSFHVQLISMTLKVGLTDQAEDATHDALKWWPNEPSLLNQLALIHESKSRWQDAADVYAEAIPLSPNYARMRFSYAKVLLVLDKPEEALQQILRALELDRSQFGYYRVLSQVLVRLKRYDDAVLALRESEERKLKMEEKDPGRIANKLRALHTMLERAMALIG